MSARLVAGAAAAVLFGAWLADATAAWRAARRKRLEWLAGGAALKARLLAMRRRDFCPAQSISYANTDPLLVVEGTGATLTDESGRRFLDTRNNVCHVGHAHPAVAAAVAQQVAVLNTNTRYLHMNVCGLARKLLDTMPAPLRDGVVFFVNSGSEANDLAVRLARTATGHERCVVVDHAYHGHTITALGLSPYKYEHRSFAGRGQPSWVTKCAAPDVYRGAHRGADAAERYAKSVEEACAAGDVAAFFIESGMSVAGVILPPPGYLARCYAAVRGAGGVCVADEVQTGLAAWSKWPSWRGHSWPPAAHESALRLEAALRTRDGRPGTSDCTERPWPFCERPPKTPFSPRLTIQASAASASAGGASSSRASCPTS